MAKDILESRYQSQLIKKLRALFDGCIITKLDPDYLQGVPDLLILWRDKWATLECKRDAFAPHRPNQDYYVERMNEMSFSAYIYPENEERVLYELQRSFEA